MADGNKKAKTTKRNERIAQPSSPCKKLKADPANGVPTGALPAELPELVGDPVNTVDLASAPSQGTGASASTRGNDMGIAKPWGVETPEIAPQLPGDDASPTPIEVQKCIRGVAAYVVTTLPTFFKDHSG